MWFQAWNHPKADRLYVEEATDNAVGTRMRDISRHGILEGPMLDFWRLFGLDRLWPRRVKTDSRNVPNILYMHFWPLMQRSLFNMIFCSVRATRVGTDETYWIPQTKHGPNTKYWFSSLQSFSPSDCYSLRDWRWWSWRSPASRQPLSYSCHVGWCWREM